MSYVRATGCSSVRFALRRMVLRMGSSLTALLLKLGVVTGDVINGRALTAEQ